MPLLGVFNFLVLVLLLNGVCVFLAKGEVHNFVFVVKETNLTKLCETITVLTVNGSFPGPTIRVRRGDTAYVNVYNEGNYGVTIHWHGVKQPRNPWSDGPEHITQCGIHPGTNFTYEIIFSEEEGTLWWHAHTGWARATVHGAIVILPPAGQLYPFPQPDGEEVIVLGNWFDGDIKSRVEYALKLGIDIAAVSSSFTINGETGDFFNCSKETTRRFVVESGKTYHLRLVNAASNGNLFFSIAEHNLTVVGTDAAYTKPFVTNYVMLSPGTTIDVLVTTNQKPSYYYMAAREYFSKNSEFGGFDHVNATAILEYKGDYDPPSVPLFPSNTLPTYKDHYAAITFVDRFRSLANEKYPISVPKNITTHMYVTVSLGKYICNGTCDTEYGVSASLNNMSWLNPSIDILQAYYGNISGVYDIDFPDNPPHYFNFTSESIATEYEDNSKVRKVKVLNYGEEVEIVFQTTNLMNSTQSHPMHLHGHSFYVLGSGKGNFDPANDPKNYNLIDPPYVNTILVPRVGWTTIRFVANNPGVWLMHCHYDRHLTWGMDTVFVVKNGGTSATSMLPPPAYMPPCNGSTTSHIQQSIDSYEEGNLESY